MPNAPHTLGAVLIAVGSLAAIAGTAMLFAGVLTAVVVRRPREGRCPRCDYDLAGLKGDLCPECGWRRPSRGHFLQLLARLGLDQADRLMVKGGLLLVGGGVIIALGS